MPHHCLVSHIYSPDIAALQQRTGALSAMSLASRGSETEAPSAAALAAAAAAAAAARQMSVDAEAIKIVIHDVDDRTPRRVTLRRDPNDIGHRCKLHFEHSSTQQTNEIDRLELISISNLD